mgnify:FL=1
MGNTLSYDGYALVFEDHFDGLTLNRICWYVDGALFHEARQWFSARHGQAAEPFPASFNHDMYIILNLAAGGNWVGYPDETTDFENAVFAVDHVRVYQKDNEEECV